MRLAISSGCSMKFDFDSMPQLVGSFDRGRGVRGMGMPPGNGARILPKGRNSSPRLDRFGIAIDLLILGWHSRCGVMPSVRRPYAADDRLCPFVDVNVLDA